MLATQPNDPKRSDGKAVVVTAVSEFDKGAFVRKHRGVDVSWSGFACANAVSGDQVALTIAPYEFELMIPSDVEAEVGAILYIEKDTGEITDKEETGEGENEKDNVPFMKVTVEKDENNVVWGILLPQLFDW
jgi:hypothetical protein